MIQRTPRNYNGTKSPFKKMDELLVQVVAEIGKESDESWQMIFLVWKNLLGEKMAALTEPLSFHQGVFTVKVKSATLYHLLSQHERPRLLEQLKKKFPIKKLVFRVG